MRDSDSAVSDFHSLYQFVNENIQLGLKWAIGIAFVFGGILAKQEWRQNEQAQDISVLKDVVQQSRENDAEFRARLISIEKGVDALNGGLKK